MSFKIIDVDKSSTLPVLVMIMQQVCTYLQSFSHCKNQ